MNNAMKLIILLIILILIRYLSNSFINSKHVPKNNIHDVCHNFLPTVGLTRTKNYIYDFYTILPVLLVFVLSCYYCDLSLAYEFAVIIIILNALRPIFYAITILPDPTERCEKNKQIHSDFYEFFVGSCKDMIFSGHIANSFMGLMYLMKYFGLKPIYAALHQIILIIWMLCSKRHYTVDIIIAYLVSILLFDYKDKIFKLLEIK